MMHTNLKEMRCGGCSGQLFRLFQKKDDIVVECQGCKSDSIISVEQPKLKIDWGEKAEGLLCVWPGQD